jgi:hypothetical protein
MNQSNIKVSNAKTQTASAPAHLAKALPLRRGQVFAGGLMHKAGVLAMLLGFSLGASLLTAQETPQYKFVAIPLPGPGPALGINNDGLVTGFYTDPTTGDVLSFLFRDGDLITGIAAPDDTITALGPANNRGVESGNVGGETNSQAVFYDIRRGSYYYLPEIPGLPFSFGDGVNDFGHATGISYESGSFSGGNGLGTNWIWDGENYSFFDVPGAVNGTEVGGINDEDQVTGYYVDASGLPKGFVKDGRKFTTFNAPGALLTVAFGINNLGMVSGLYVNTDTSHHGYTWSQGKFVTVDVTLPGANGTLWYGSNDRGDLAGLYYSGSNHVENAVIALRQDGCANSKGPK